MSYIEHYSINKKGRDFVVGDIHGMFHWLTALLKEVNFDESKDRLFCVGDLVDRGPHSIKVKEFLKKKWFHSVRGNHEDMIINRIFDYAMDWLDKLTDDQVFQMRTEFSKLPIAIEVDTSYGMIGIVHAEIPDFIDDWKTFRLELSYDQNAKDEAMWGLSRLKDIQYFQTVSDYETLTSEQKREFLIRKYRDHVKNINYTFHGHSVIATPVKRSNQFFIETGAVFKNMGTFNKGCLTMVDFTHEDKFDVYKYSNFDGLYYEKTTVEEGFAIY